jgi:TLD/BTB/POZ domain
MSDEPSASLSGERDLEKEIVAAGDDIGRLVQPAFNLMMEELQSLIDRKAALAVYLNMIVSDSEREHKLNDVNSSILKLNVGGKDINVRKGSILPRTSPESLFGILASGRWDNHLTKDQNGRIFLDIDPEWIEVIINVLRETGKIVLPCVATGKECGFRAVLACYNLKSLFADFTISLSEVSTIAAMNDPSNRETLHSFLRPEVEDDKPRGFMLNLLYRRSIHGSEPAKLHGQCQDKGDTLTVIEDTKGSVFGIYAEGEWKRASPNFVGKKSFFFYLTEKVAEKEDLFKKTPFRNDPNNTSAFTLFFGDGFYISSTGAGYCTVGSHMASHANCRGDSCSSNGHFVVKEIEIYHIDNMTTPVSVDPVATVAASTSDIPDPNPYSMAVESDGKLTEIASSITSSSLIMAERMADYNKAFVARLRSLSESVFKAERELLMEILLVHQLTTPARCRDIKAGLQGRWEATLAGISAMTSTNCGNKQSDMIKELLTQLNVTGATSEKSKEEETSKPKPIVECEEVVSYNVGGTIIAVLKSTLVRHAPDSVFASRVSDRWPKSADEIENGHVCLVSMKRCDR